MFSGAAPGEVLLLHGRPERGAQRHHRLGRPLDLILHWSHHWQQHWFQENFFFKFHKNTTRDPFSGNWIWAIIWCIASILVYAAVIFGMMKTRKIFLLPALCVSVFNVLVGIINGIINFIILNWIG